MSILSRTNALVLLIIILSTEVIKSDIFDLRLVKDLQHYFSVKWIVLHSCKKFQFSPEILRIVAMLKKEANVFISVYDWNDFEFFSKKISEFSYVHTMVLFSCWLCGNGCLLEFNKINKYQMLRKFIWVASLENQTDFQNVYFPMDFHFISIKKNFDNPQVLSLHELYQVSQDFPLKIDAVGYWNELNGLDFKNPRFEDKRADFYGDKINTFYTPPPAALDLKYPSFLWDIFKVLAHRLNISLNVTSDRTDHVELDVSITMMQSNNPRLRKGMEYFSPVFVSKVILYYKDVPSKLLLDSFIRPFHVIVWIIILFYIIVIAITSYEINKILKVLLHRKSSVQFYQHVFESAVILLQKYDTVQENFISQRIIKITQWMLSLLLYSLYSGIFIAYVTVILRSPPFSDLEGFLADGRYNIVSAGLDPKSSYFEGHTDIRVSSAFKYYHYHPLNDVNSSKKMARMICYDTQKYVGLQTYFNYQESKLELQDCALSNTYIPLHKINMCWTILKNSSYKRIIDHYLLRLFLSGSIMDVYNLRTKAKLIPDLQQFFPIEIEHIVFLIMCLSGGIILSSIIFILEIHFYRLSVYYQNL